MQGDEFFSHYLFHQLKGRLARAVSAVKNSVQLCKLPSRLNDDSLFVLVMLALTLHHVESAENIIGLAAEKLPVSVKDIEYAVMGGWLGHLARLEEQQPALAALRDNKALLVGEVVLDFFAAAHTGQLSVALRVAPSACNSAEQEQLVVKPHIAVYELNIRQLENIRVNTDVALTVVVRFCGGPLHDYRCLGIQLCKGQDTPRMVVMTVAEYNCINSGQVNAEGFRILHNCVSLPRIKEQSVLFSLDIYRKSVLGYAAFVCGSILHKGDYLHQWLPQEWLPQPWSPQE